jgi:hypothetical protein
MFGIPRDRLLANLEKLRKNLCCYDRQPCDCKYMNDQTVIQQGGVSSGEDTGCCELTMVIELLSNLSEEAYEAALATTDILI